MKSWETGREADVTRDVRMAVLYGLEPITGSPHPSPPVLGRVVTTFEATAANGSEDALRFGGVQRWLARSVCGSLGVMIAL